MVLCVKYRRKLLLNRDIVEALQKICVEISDRYWFEFKAIGTDGDPVHLFLGAAPRYSSSRIMQIIKSNTARELFDRYPEIKKQLWGSEYWSDGGYIGTVGDDVTAEIIKNYIETQGTVEERENYTQMKLYEFD
jgi:putative transposase